MDYYFSIDGHDPAHGVHHFRYGFDGDEKPVYEACRKWVDYRTL
jgi:hypothetical protein